MSIFTDIHKLYKHYDLISGTEVPHIPDHFHDRLNHLKEELNEAAYAYKQKNLEEIVDGLIDLIVIAAGTLSMMGVDSQKHWDEVLRANSEKIRGVHPKRGHALDIIKPEGWRPPDHEKIIDETLASKGLTRK